MRMERIGKVVLGLSLSDKWEWKGLMMIDSIKVDRIMAVSICILWSACMFICDRVQRFVPQVGPGHFIFYYRLLKYRILAFIWCIICGNWDYFEEVTYILNLLGQKRQSPEKALSRMQTSVTPLSFKWEWQWAGQQVLNPSPEPSWSLPHRSELSVSTIRSQ